MAGRHDRSPSTASPMIGGRAYRGGTNVAPHGQGLGTPFRIEPRARAFLSWASRLPYRATACEVAGPVATAGPRPFRPHARRLRTLEAWLRRSLGRRSGSP